MQIVFYLNYILIIFYAGCVKVIIVNWKYLLHVHIPNYQLKPQISQKQPINKLCLFLILITY